MGLEEFRRLINRQSIDASTSLVGFDAFPRRRHVLTRERLRKQALPPQAFLFMKRRTCFIACRVCLGFTLAAHDPLRFPGLLMRCISKIHNFPALLLVGPFAGHPATMASADFSLRSFDRRPFRHKARSPQVRTLSFPAQSSHLRHFALTTRASQSLACSPCSVPPHMRFVFLDSRFRSTLPSHARSPSRSCASLRSLWSARGRTFTSKIVPMLGALTIPRQSRGFSNCEPLKAAKRGR